MSLIVYAAASKLGFSSRSSWGREAKAHCSYNETIMPIRAAVCLWKASLSISFKYAVNKTSRTFESSLSWMTFDKKMFHNVIQTRNFYVTLYQDCSSHHDSSKNMAARGRGLFSLFVYIENFKNLVKNQWNGFSITWQECFFVDPLLRLCKPSWFVKKHGR